MLPIFPEFRPLTLDDKADYEQLVAEYPPFSDISFATLHIWWNLEGNLELSSLNGNIVLSYNLSFDAANSGYSLVGKTRLEESMTTIFDYLREQGRPVKLVHVPEFVITEIKDQSTLHIIEEIDYNEYILESRDLAGMKGTPHRITRRKVRRFWEAMEGKQVDVRELDLSLPEVQAELYQAVLDWEKTKPVDNDPGRTEHKAIKKTLDHATHLDIKHLGVYIDGTLRGFQLYNRTTDNRYYILHHLKVDYSIPYIFNYLTHHVADMAVKEDVEFLNMEMDLGIQGLREHKMGLRPVEFFRKYTVEPAA